MKNHLICIILLLTVFGCSSDKKERAGTGPDQVADSTLNGKIIKTADMRFRVKNVQTTKEKLADLIKTEGGTIAEFNIHSQIRENEKVKYTTDSLLELISYRVEGLVVARVPTEKLDNFTNQVVKMAVFIDDQSLKLDNQSLTYLSNQLKSQNKQEALTQLRKTDEKKTRGAEKSLEIRDADVDHQINNLEIDQKVKFSTVTLNFYQDNTVKKIIVGNDNLSDYRPDFFRRLWLSLQNGWSIFKEFILILADLWMLILVVIVGYLLFRRYRSKRLPV